MIARLSCFYLPAIISLLLLWSCLSLLLGEHFFPYPWSVTLFFIKNFSQTFAPNLFYSFYRVAIGTLLAVVIATPLGLVTGCEKSLQRLFDPYIQIFYPIPKIIFLPMIFILLGIGDNAKIVIVALKTGFQILVILRDHAKNLEPHYIHSLKSLEGSRWHLYRHVVFPSCIPSLFTALRINMGTALSILFICESYATEYGIGAYIMEAFARFDATAMLAGTMGMGLLGIFFFILLNTSEWLFCPWKRRFSS